MLVKQYARKQTAARADWLIGAGLLTRRVHGAAIRSMKAPGTAYDDPRLGRDPQPAHMSDFVLTTEDDGGVHINSGIPNHAFYLAATAVGGYAWNAVGKVWYQVMQNLVPRSTFADCARQCRQVSRGMSPALGQRTIDAIDAAWTAVGL